MYAGYHSAECLMGKPHLTCTDGCYNRQDELQAAWECRNGAGCQNCGQPFDAVGHRWLCPHCKTKNTCCE